MRYPVGNHSLSFLRVLEGFDSAYASARMRIRVDKSKVMEMPRKPRKCDSLLGADARGGQYRDVGKFK